MLFKRRHDKTILVTGGSGFLGQHVIRKLQTEYHNYNIVSSPPSKKLDLVDPRNVKKLFKKLKPSIVIHLAAACGGIGANKDRPGEFYYKNMMMGTNIIEASRVYGVEKLVLIGTVCSYPKHCVTPFKEEYIWLDYPEETNAPYGIAKKAMLVQAQAYRQQYGLNSIYLLPANLYGPGDNYDSNTSHVIPAIIKKIQEARANNAKSITLWGSGSVSREFLYVSDAAKAIVLATLHYNKSEPVNIGTGESITIKELAGIIAKCMQYTGDIMWDKSKPDGQPRRMLDVTKAEKYFLFKASTNIHEGILKTLDSLS